MWKDLETEYEKEKKRYFRYAMIIDAVGVMSYFVPILGEGFDFFWGPVSGFLIFILFRKTSMAIIGTVEEMIPFATDWIPTALIAWFLTYKMNEEKALTEFKRRKQLKTRILSDSSDIVTIDQTK